MNRVIKWVRSIILAVFLIMIPTIAFAQAASDNLPEDNINIQYWQVITGFVLPLALSTIIQTGWSAKLQALVAFGVALVVTVVQMWIYGQLDNIVDPVQSILIVFALTITFYKGWWRPTGVSPAIENATNMVETG